MERASADTSRVIDVIGAFSLAADMALGLTAGHGVRAAYIGLRLADALCMRPALRADLFYAELLMDAGCTAWASQTAAAILGDDITARRHMVFMCDPRDPRDLVKWLARYVAAGERLTTRVRRSVDFVVHGHAFMREGLENTSEVAARLARRLGRSAGVQEALRFFVEQWDGSGPRRLRAAQTPMASRILLATLHVEVLHQIAGREAAVRMARERRGKALDPDVVDAFLGVARDEDFWRALESEQIWPIVRDMEPESEYRSITSAQLDEAMTAFADFADLKSFYSAGHSRRVAALSEQMATVLRLPPEEIAAIRRAALLHDIGVVAVPSFVLHKAEDRLSDAERESVRLHPYHAERILSYVPAFASIVPLVAAHHERPDGTGYFRGLSGSQLPPGACVIAVADRFDELTHARPGQAALDVREALREIESGAGTAFSIAAVGALAETAPKGADIVAAGRTRSMPERRSTWPAGLTNREVEVLRLLVTGASRRVIAAHLSVSEHTVRHHLEHIYGKLDVRTRVEATLFAVEHGLIQ
jgi:HD-GYP domain-containing protein (c-di-GMP phosphodiesterase class II)/DNA-binding CsgD family transcriptional regulator